MNPEIWGIPMLPIQALYGGNIQVNAVMFQECSHCNRVHAYFGIRVEARNG